MEDSARITALENQVRTLQQQSGTSGINRTIGTLDKKVIESAISDSIIDIVWDKYFYYHTYFDSLDGWNFTENPSPGGSTFNGGGVSLVSASGSGDYAFIIKNPAYQKVLSFDLESRFRTGFVADNTSCYFSTGIGDSSGPGSYPYYGFRAESGSLYAVTSNGSSTETKKLAMSGLDGTSVYQLECRLYPGSKAVFYASDAGASVLKERCTITTTLPTGAITLTSSWITFVVISKTAATGQVLFTFAEYIQRRNPQSI